MAKLEMWYPFSLDTRTQAFGENAAPLYKAQGLLGHTAEDWQPGLGTPIPCCAENSYCYSLLNQHETDLTKYKGIFTIVEPGDGFVYEISYGHCRDMFAEVGETYNPGDVLGTVGNAGDIYSQGHPLTLEERALGIGAHLHGPQVRLCKKVSKVDNKKGYLRNGQGLLQKDGFFFEIVDIHNGYNGCLDPGTLYNKYYARDYKKVISIQEQIISILKTILGQK